MFRIKLISRAIRQFATKTSVAKTKKSRTTRSKEFKVQTDILEYFKLLGQEDILDLFPPKLLRKKHKFPDSYYIANREAADTIANHILRTTSVDDTLLELNPGPGLLTDHLAKINNLNVHLFEPHDGFEEKLKKKFETENTRIKVYRNDLVNMWKIGFQDRIDNGTRIQEILADIPVRSWTDPPIQLFAGLGSLNFFKYLLYSIVRQCDLFSHGRFEMYLVVPPPVYIHLTCSKQAGYIIYRANTILFQMMFEYKYLEKIPKKFFLPWQHEMNASKHVKLSKFYSIDSDYLYLVKIAPRTDIYELCPLEYMQALLYFTKQNCVSRKKRVIPTLEKWAPGCGPRMIVQPEMPSPVKPLYDEIGNDIPKFSVPCTTMSNKDFYPKMNIFTEFGDLSPSQLLTLFTQFRQWPEFQESPFLASMENSLLKIETSEQETMETLILNDDEDDAIENKKHTSSEKKKV